MIPIQNIYYMLCYAFQRLNQGSFKKLAVETFKNAEDMFAAILITGLSSQIKRGLGKEYVEQSQAAYSVTGKIELNESIHVDHLIRNELVCTYDEFTVNSYLNQILKTTLLVLAKRDLSKKRKKSLRKLLVYFKEVDVLDPAEINWHIQYNRNSSNYQMLISICFLTIKGLLQTQKNGEFKLMDFLDEQSMPRLYEKFILEYYRKEFPQLKPAASQIPWALDDGMGFMLPIMQSDITLSYKGRILIIDAKYYSHNLQVHYNKRTIHSGNLYQIFTYVKNKQEQFKDKSFEVSGLLLYAKTKEEIQPDNTYQLSGNQISVKNIDLNKNFTEIAGQLNSIVKDHFDLE